jgi:para-aminobenzoate synthetase/4-amino-4-deoxychorismate lyase
MKGTAARRPSWVDDEAAWRALGLSEKERAENIMITDLVRNDLGRLCAAGTVEAPVLCEVARHPTVHQMTSLVRGILRPGRSLYEIFAATFPPGSVTGAPKVRAMQIIKELEAEPRGVYCGTVGVFFPHGDFELNVGIRTVEIRNKEQGARIKSIPSLFVPSSLFPVSSVLGLGSGIVADSDAGAEWREVWLKSRFLTVAALPEFDLLETLRWTDQDGFVNLRCHLRRMRCSATYFGWRFPLVKIIAELRTLASGYFSAPKSIETGERRVRILLTKTGDVRVETQPFGPWPERAVKIFVYEDERVDAEDILLYHKTTARGIYERALAAARAAGCDEAVLVNSRGEITEGTISSVFVKRGGEWWTPALACGLLPGIYRELELAAGRCREAVLSVEDLREAEEVVVGNSGRGGSAGSKIRA